MLRGFYPFLQQLHREFKSLNKYALAFDFEAFLDCIRLKRNRRNCQFFNCLVGRKLP